MTLWSHLIFMSLRSTLRFSGSNLMLLYLSCHWFHRRMQSRLGWCIVSECWVNLPPLLELDLDLTFYLWVLTLKLTKIWNLIFSVQKLCSSLFGYHLSFHRHAATRDGQPYACACSEEQSWSRLWRPFTLDMWACTLHLTNLNVRMLLHCAKVKDWISYA